MWLSLGPLQDPFRGKNTFALPPNGLTIADALATSDTVLSRAASALHIDRAAVQMIEWRQIAGEPVWVVRTARNEVGTVFDAKAGAPWEPSPK